LLHGSHRLIGCSLAGWIGGLCRGSLVLLKYVEKESSIHAGCGLEFDPVSSHV
jgi:hypothetical protein